MVVFRIADAVGIAGGYTFEIGELPHEGRERSAPSHSVWPVWHFVRVSKEAQERWFALATPYGEKGRHREVGFIIVVGSWGGRDGRFTMRLGCSFSHGHVDRRGNQGRGDKAGKAREEKQLIVKGGRLQADKA